MTSFHAGRLLPRMIRSLIDTIYRYMRWVQGVGIPRAQFPRLIGAIIHEENSAQPFNINFINCCKDAE